jgi:hypothetical protein
LTYQHDTYDRRIQLGASRRRREDAEALHEARRWGGAIYLAGYAIECSLCALVCSHEGKNNFKDTRLFKKGIQGATLHNLTHLLQALPAVQRAITLDRTGIYKDAWNIITSLWQKDELRYWDKLGDEHDSERFMASVKLLHTFILNQQGEAS